MMEVKQLIDERQSTHGDYTDNAKVSQAIKAILREQPGWSTMTNRQRESLDMIACKIGRIMSGQSHFKDHWADISGYAQLALR